MSFIARAADVKHFVRMDFHGIAFRLINLRNFEKLKLFECTLVEKLDVVLEGYHKCFYRVQITPLGSLVILL